MALNPTLQTSIQPESPVTRPASGEGIAGLLGTFLSAEASTRGGGSGGPTQKDRDSAFREGMNAQLIDIMQEAQNYRDQGEHRAATRLERVAKTNYAKHLSLKEAEGVIEAFTGRSMEDFGSSTEEIVRRKAMESPEFQQGVLASYALDNSEEMSEPEREDYALSLMARKESNEATMVQTQFNWNKNEGQSSRLSLLDDFMNQRVGLLNMDAFKEGKVTVEDVEQTKLEFAELAGQIRASHPGAGVPADDWKPIEERIVAIENSINLVSDMTSNSAIVARDVSQVLRALNSLPNEVAQGFEKSIVRQILVGGNTDYLTQGHFHYARFEEILNATYKVVEEDFASTVEAGNNESNIQADDGAPFSKIEMNIADGTPQENFTNAQAIVEAMGGIGEVIGNRKALSQWTQLTSAGLANLYNMASSNDAWDTAEGYRSFYTDDFFNNMKKLNRAGEATLYNAVRNKAIATIDVNQSALRNSIRSTLGDGAVQYDQRNNRLTMDWDSIALGDTNLAPKDVTMLRQAVDIFYSGDFQALLKDKGAKFRQGRSDYGNYDEAGYAKQSLAVEAAAAYGSVSSQFDNENVTQRVEAIEQLERFRGRLPVLEVQEEEEEELMPASVSSRSSPEAATQLVSLIDQHEGGGNYDTLFGHSQRSGKDFSGVEVSKMTLGELSDFSKGEYADWSKDELGYVATPMGKYQIVGTTLRQTAKEMGLPNNTVFTESVQDAMFHHLAKKALKGKSTAEAKRKGMRAMWDGFKNVGNAELDSAIAQFEGTEPPSLETIQRDSDNTLQAVRQSDTPQARPLDLDTSGGGDTGGGGASSAPQVAATAPVSPATVPEGASGEATQREVVNGVPQASKQEVEMLSKNTREMLKKMEVDVDSMPAFDNQEELNIAVEQGLVEDGDVVLVEGRTQIV